MHQMICLAVDVSLHLIAKRGFCGNGAIAIKAEPFLKFEITSKMKLHYMKMHVLEMCKNVGNAQCKNCYK